MYIAKLMMHKWEEEPISGIKKGYSGTFAIFFYGCNMNCIFCQNAKISHINFLDIKNLAKKKINRKIIYDENELSDLMLKAELDGAYSISFITSVFYMESVVKTIKLSKEKGLKIPIVYNSSGFEKAKDIKKLDGLIDIYLPDFKYFDDDLCIKYSKRKNYVNTAKECIDEMYRQVGECDLVNNKGVIVRHLILPSHTNDSIKILKYLYSKYKNKICYSIMSQYTPIEGSNDIDNFTELKRRLTKREYEKVINFAVSIGIENGYMQEMDVAKESFIPDFN